MSSKRFKKLNEDNNPKGDIFSKLISEIKKNCTVKFDESIDLSLQIYNKQKKNEINIRTSVNLPSGTGKSVKIGVVCEDSKQQIAKDAGAEVVGGDDMIEKIKSGDLRFDKLICTSTTVKLDNSSMILFKSAI